MDITAETLDTILGALEDQLRNLGERQEFASRFDQIHFKLFAMVDQAGGRHEADLRAMQPGESELISAARWSITQDPSPGYRMVLREALGALGIEDDALRS